MDTRTIEIQRLREYVSSSEPVVNKLLRAHQDASNYTFDSLFAKAVIPQSLYRLLPNEFVNIEGNSYKDDGYLSFTKSIDKGIDHFSHATILACLEFELPKSFLCIDVCNLLTTYNDEGEFILPRGLTFNVDYSKSFSGEDKIQLFLDSLNSRTSSKELCDFWKITTIYHYKLSLINCKKFYTKVSEGKILGYCELIKGKKHNDCLQTDESFKVFPQIKEVFEKLHTKCVAVPNGECPFFNRGEFEKCPYHDMRTVI